MVNYAKRNNSKRKMSVRRVKRSATINNSNLQKVVSKMIMRKVEPKHKNFDHGKTESYHNLINTVHLNKDACMPSQGTQDQQRVGDRINVGAFMVRMLCGQKADRPNITWKFWVVRIPRSESVGYSSLFENLSGNAMLDPINKDYCKVLKTLTINSKYSVGSQNSTTYSDEYTFPVKLYIPYKKLIKFNSNASTDHNDHDIYLVWHTFDAFGTLTTDNIAYGDITSTIYYKDP